MERINLILRNPKYISSLQEIAECEKERVFCKHDTNHFFSVARIMYIHSLEQNLKLEKAIIYATALLHDIGRHMEYTNDIPHAIASASLAKEILLAVGGFSQEEQSRIAVAISKHNACHAQDPLTSSLQWADHESRVCIYCTVKSQCKWSEEEKNREVRL
ncbi:MAG TPA: HD domain-containing protein [Epulopiscium sp.]|nr:HD domain-containing protein [Candidatus Epulonipiscium sp.]